MAITKTQKGIAIAAIFFLLIIAVMFIYRVFFEFNNRKVRQYIMSETEKYGKDSTAAANVLHEGVMHILNDRFLTAQVRQTATAGNLEKERVLVDAAVLMSKNLGYIS